MSAEKVKHESSEGHGGFEHQDLQASGIVYFMLGLLVVTVISMFGLKGLYAYLDHRERATQTPPNPLVKQVPEDTRHVTGGYPETAFPSPRLEEDERGQLNGILMDEENKLYSYGWVDQQAGVVRIPIDRAMDEILRQGLPARAASEATSTAESKAPVGTVMAPSPEGLRGPCSYLFDKDSSAGPR